MRTCSRHSIIIRPQFLPTVVGFCPCPPAKKPAKTPVKAPVKAKTPAKEPKKKAEPKTQEPKKEPKKKAEPKKKTEPEKKEPVDRFANYSDIDLIGEILARNEDRRIEQKRNLYRSFLM